MSILTVYGHLNNYRNISTTAFVTTVYLLCTWVLITRNGQNLDVCI